MKLHNVFPCKTFWGFKINAHTKIGKITTIDFTRIHKIGHEITNGSFTRWFEQKPPATLDLHGFTLEEAFHSFKSFLLKHSQLHTKKIRIITGKGLLGNGQIKRELPLWLERKDIAPLVLKTETPPLNKGGNGALIIYLRKEKK